MIKIDTNQRKRCKELCEEYDESALGASIHIVRVREHKLREIWVTEGGLKISKTISLPELEANPKNQHTPVFCGLVLSVGLKDETGVVKGDLIRFTPNGGEEWSSPDGSIEFIRIDQYALRSFSHSIYTDDDSKFCEPPPEDAPVN